MNIYLRLMHDKVMQYKVDAPCKGDAAKALGKYKLEETTDLSVKFSSYQEAPGRPERQLADDEPVQRGSILNFSVNIDSVLQQQRLHTRLLKELYVDRVRSLLAKYSSRFFAAPLDSVKNTGGCKLKFAEKELAEAVRAALTEVGCCATVEEFSDALDENYKSRNGEEELQLCCTFRSMESGLLKLYIGCSAEDQHINTDVQLEKEFKKLRKAGVVELLGDDMPVECSIIDHYEVFLQARTPQVLAAMNKCSVARV